MTKRAFFDEITESEIMPFLAAGGTILGAGHPLLVPCKKHKAAARQPCKPGVYECCIQRCAANARRLNEEIDQRD